MESGRCAKSWGTGKCHSCFKLKEKVDSKNCVEVPLGDLGKNQNWIVHEKPGKKQETKDTAITRRQHNFTQNWPYLPKLTFPFDYNEIRTSTMHFTMYLTIFL